MKDIRRSDLPLAAHPRASYQPRALVLFPGKGSSDGMKMPAGFIARVLFVVGFGIAGATITSELLVRRVLQWFDPLHFAAVVAIVAGVISAIVLWSKRKTDEDWRHVKAALVVSVICALVWPIGMMAWPALLLFGPFGFAFLIAISLLFAFQRLRAPVDSVPPPGLAGLVWQVPVASLIAVVITFLSLGQTDLMFPEARSVIATLGGWWCLFFILHFRRWHQGRYLLVTGVLIFLVGLLTMELGKGRPLPFYAGIGILISVVAVSLIPRVTTSEAEAVAAQPASG